METQQADRRPRSNWPDERTARLKELFEAGKSYPVIAKEMDTTKGVVVGKLARLGLGREKGTDRKSSGPSQQRPRREPAPPVVPARLVRLELLAKGECKWPVSRDDEAVWLFCGAGTDGLYCAGHHRKAYGPSTPVNLDELMGFR